MLPWWLLLFLPHKEAEREGGWPFITRIINPTFFLFLSCLGDFVFVVSVLFCPLISILRLTLRLFRIA